MALADASNKFINIENKMAKWKKEKLDSEEIIKNNLSSG